MAKHSDSLDSAFSIRLGFHIAMLIGISLVGLLFALFTVGG
jgi:hypothetical protein